MRVETKTLIADLKKRTEENIISVEELQKLSTENLSKRRNPEAWNALECIEHLNRYGNFYLPEINFRLENAQKSTQNMFFKSGWLGNKFALMMLPGAKGMSTFKEMNTLNRASSTSTIANFLDQQKQLLEILKRCKNYKLDKLKTSISISKLIKLKLGDTLRVVIYHNQRHILQAQKAIL